MKKRALFPALFLLLCALCAYALAVGGGADDPLVPLSYLNGSYTDTVNQKIDALLSGSAGESGIAAADGWTEARLKSGDTLSCPTGGSVLLLAGSATVSFPAGAVVDVTDGKEIPAGTALTHRHRYLAAEQTTALVTITSKTAVVSYQGPYSLSYSAAVDYNAMAQALKTMGLFRGSFTGYGSGFDLEVAPTRLQALIMFIRLLGEEDAALAYQGSTPFTDIAAGSEPEKYVGYAYEMGYTNGFTATSFRPSQPVNAYQYTEFVLRALGYSSTATTDLRDTLERAVSCGVLTAGESAALASGAFLRADLVYVSYYALDVPQADQTGTLRQTLLSKGIFTQADSAAASALITGPRMA